MLPLLDSLFDGIQQAGNYTATYDTTNPASGVYSCSMRAGDSVQTN